MQTIENFLPDDGLAGALVGRVWNPSGPNAGPMVVTVRESGVIDITAAFPTVADLLDQVNPADALRAASGTRLASVAELLANSHQPVEAPVMRFLAPVDVQVIKACGVTFADSMLERVIEERAKGDAAGAARVRAEIA